MLDILPLRPQLAPPGASVLVFQETPAEAAVLPLRLVQSELSSRRLSLRYVAGEVGRPGDLRGELALLT